MIDHKHIYHAMIQRESENEQMKDLEQRAAPLMWLAFVVAIVACLAVVDDVRAAYQENEVLSSVVANAMNGSTVGVGSAVMRCEVKELILRTRYAD